MMFSHKTISVCRKCLAFAPRVTATFPPSDYLDALQGSAREMPVDSVTPGSMTHQCAWHPHQFHIRIDSDYPCLYTPRPISFLAGGTFWAFAPSMPIFGHTVRSPQANVAKKRGKFKRSRYQQPRRCEIKRSTTHDL